MSSRKFFLLCFFLCTVCLVFCAGQSIAEKDYRYEMRRFVIKLAGQARAQDPDFIIIPQNGQELLLTTPDYSDRVARDYAAAIDGVAREDLFFGYKNDDEATPEEASRYMLAYLDLAGQIGLSVLVVDYCYSKQHMQASYKKNAGHGFIPFAADSRGLDTIPAYPESIFNMNKRDINSLKDASNWLYLINPGGFSSKKELLAAISRTNYDLLVIDLYFYDDIILTHEDVAALKVKASGGRRLVVAYMSIGEAEDYRYYWHDSWLREDGRPRWLYQENPQWKGNYKVFYWDEDWQKIIYNSRDSYLNKILKAGFDGVYLDIIDAFEYYESLTE